MAHPDKYTRLWNRRNPDDSISKALFETLSTTRAEKEFKYMVDAMSPIDAEFTENTFAEGERVRNQLEKNLAVAAEFEFQGSVTNDTHIRRHSDIDLLVLHSGFYSVDDGVTPVPSKPYAEGLAELLSMRTDAAQILKDEFPEVNVNDDPGKSIALEGGSLRRKIDVVIGNWWNTELWKQYNVKMARGVSILNSKVPTTIKNKPFWHNYEIDTKDNKTGGLRKVIRLLKTLKYDADPELSMSSYDVAALGWNMSEAALTVGENAYLELARNARSELKRFIDNEALRNSLNVPNGTRKVFCPEGATLDGLNALHRELDELIGSIERGILLEKARDASGINEGMFPTWKEIRPKAVLKYSYK